MPSANLSFPYFAQNSNHVPTAHNENTALSVSIRFRTRKREERNSEFHWVLQPRFSFDSNIMATCRSLSLIFLSARRQSVSNLDGPAGLRQPGTRKNQSRHVTEITLPLPALVIDLGSKAENEKHLSAIGSTNASDLPTMRSTRATTRKPPRNSPPSASRSPLEFVAYFLY